jgi:predicted nucleic acid-binding protein
MLVDTGFLIAIIDAGDELRRRAQAWLEHLERPLILTEYVWLETLNFFSATPFRSQSTELLDQLITSEDCEFVEVRDALRHEALKLHFGRSDKSWSLTDCVSFVIMHQRGIARALAYDHHFEQAGFEPLLRQDPT